MEQIERIATPRITLRCYSVTTNHDDLDFLFEDRDLGPRVGGVSLEGGDAGFETGGVSARGHHVLAASLVLVFQGRQLQGQLSDRRLRSILRVGQVLVVDGFASVCLLLVMHVSGVLTRIVSLACKVIIMFTW